PSAGGEARGGTRCARARAPARHRAVPGRDRAAGADRGRAGTGAPARARRRARRAGAAAAHRERRRDRPRARPARPSARDVRGPGRKREVSRPQVKRAVLAYSGGLDTSIIVPWLRENYGCEVVCYCSDVGQGGEELAGLEAKARKIGAADVIVEDLRVPFVRDFCLPALRAGAVYEGRYLLGTSLARPLIASRQVWAAQRTGCDALAHGCTGKGNDQVRFELAYMALAPTLPVIAPWREWDIVSREDALAYAQKHGVPVVQKPGDLYSRDANLWHLSHDGGALEDPSNAPPAAMHKLTPS